MGESATVDERNWVGKKGGLARKKKKETLSLKRSERSGERLFSKHQTNKKSRGERRPQFLAKNDKAKPTLRWEREAEPSSSSLSPGRPNEGAGGQSRLKKRVLPPANHKTGKERRTQRSKTRLGKKSETKKTDGSAQEQYERSKAPSLKRGKKKSKKQRKELG